MKFNIIGMGSTNEERSLTSGIPIPQWMRSKTESYGFDPSTLSPPTHEGDFFYIKYPKPQPPPQPVQPQLNLKSISKVIEGKERAFNMHTDSCKKFIPIIQDSIHVVKPKVTKPMGVDDGFKGEGAACGASVVEVAHQMLSSKGKGPRTLTRVETDGNLAPPSTSYLKTRRNSRSLPASPLSSPAASPHTKRKIESNRLMIHENGVSGSDDNLDKKSGSSWILSSLFAARETGKEGGAIIAAMAASEEESESKGVVQYRENGAKSPAVNTTAVDVAISGTATGPSKNSFFKSKPYLRDLNLLTPSSM